MALDMALIERGALAAVLAAVANLVILFAAEAALNVPDAFRPLSPDRVVVLTVLGAALAALAYALVLRRSPRDPRRTFLAVAVVALLLSFIPDVLLLARPGAQPGTTTTGVAVLMLMCVVAAVMVVVVLLRHADEAPSS